MKRVKILPKKCPNPLFERWLSEWKLEAASKGSEMEYTFGKALKSLKQYPFTLNTGQECFILDHFGPKLCQMLDKKLTEHIKEFGELPQTNTQEEDHTEAPKAKRKRVPKCKEGVTNQETCTGKKEYIPAWRSAGYAILLTLFEKSNEGVNVMTKSELQDAAQPLCDVSLKKPLPNSYYSGWSSMAQLIKKQLVCKSGNPAKFTLTELGLDTALKLKMAENTSLKDVHPEASTSQSSPIKYCLSPENNSSPPEQVISPNKCRSSPKPGTSCSPIKSSLSTETAEEETIFFMPNLFQIILLVDNAEIDGKKSELRNDATARELKSRGINFEVRKLNVGDFLWICRNKEGMELVLPYIVERKRMDDLGGSIKDGRFHEQKFRLKQSKVENLIYLVESHGNNTNHLGLPLASLQQACANTNIIDGFTVRFTNTHSSSMRYLAIMTTLLTNTFKNKTLVSCKKENLPKVDLSDDLISLMTFSDFSKGTSKIRKFKTKEIFMKQLLQLKGLSVDKCLAIVDKYPSPQSLITALNQPDGLKSIGNVKYGTLNKLVGPVIAKSLHQLYSQDKLE